MNEFFTSIKTLIEKVNLIVLLLSLAVAILVYKIWFLDLIWAGFVFCLAYPCITGFHKFIAFEYKKRRESKILKKRDEIEARKRQEEQENNKAYLCTIFESLPPDEKKGLIMLYNLPIPDGCLRCARIINDTDECAQLLWQSFIKVHAINNGVNRLVWRDSLLNQIVYIDPVFYMVLEEKSKTFEM